MDELKRKDVLIVDDDESIRTLLGIAVQRVGLSCDLAADGLQALQLTRDTCFCVVLTDLMMPRLDGIGLIQQLVTREASPYCGPILLVMTAFSMGGELPLVADFIHAIIPKPFDLAEVAALIQDCVTVRRILTQTPMEGPTTVIAYETTSLPFHAFLAVPGVRPRGDARLDGRVFHRKELTKQ